MDSRNFCPRNPKASPLYELVVDRFEEFLRVYEERFAAKRGFLREIVRKVVNRFMDCGDLRHGFARIRCENPECHNEMLLALRLGKIYPATIEILDRFRHTGFSAYQGQPVPPSDTAAREKLAISIARAPISLDRLSYDGPNGTVDYRPKSSPGHPLLADDAPHPDPLEVLASLCD